jgi:hypothetical protein
MYLKNCDLGRVLSSATKPTRRVMRWLGFAVCGRAEAGRCPGVEEHEEVIYYPNAGGQPVAGFVSKV